MTTVALRSLFNDPNEAEKVQHALKQILLDGPYSPELLKTLPESSPSPTLFWSQLASWFLAMPSETAEKLKNERVLV